MLTKKFSPMDNQIINKKAERYIKRRIAKVRLKFYLLKLPFFLVWMFRNLKRGVKIISVLFFIAITLTAVAGFTHSPAYFAASVFIWLLGILLFHLSSPKTNDFLENEWSERGEFMNLLKRKKPELFNE